MDDQNNNYSNSHGGDSTGQPEQQSTQYAPYAHQYYQQPYNSQNTTGTYNYPHSQTPAYHSESKPKRRFRNVIKTILVTVTLIRSFFVVIILFMLIGLIGLMSADPQLEVRPLVPHFSVIRVSGPIGGSGGGFLATSGYDHNLTMNYIRNLINNPNDRGILLYLDTPGGTIYHSEELYLLLLEYREQTGRPVYVYMSTMAASGGVYIAMAADHITANRITITGSVGVMFSMTPDVSGFFEEHGLRAIIIDSGEHKSTGALGSEVTPSQIAIFQDMVDEYMDYFVSIVASGRGMSESAVREFADGRIFTAQTALDFGLIDEIGTWQGTLDMFSERTDAIAFHPNLTTPLTFWESMLVRIPFLNYTDPLETIMPRLVDMPTGIPLAIAPELLS